MQLALERSNLLKALGHVQRIVERRNTVPILSNVYIEAQGQSVMLKSTDLDIEVRETIPADVKTDGSITVSAHLLYDIVRKLPDGAEIMLKSDDSMVHLESGRSTFDLPTLPSGDFPDPTPGDFAHTFSIDSIDLKSLIERTKFAISSDDNRYYLNGIYLHGLEDNGMNVLRAVATDGHRLAQSQLLAPTGSESLEGVIIPRKAVEEVYNCLEDLDQSLTLEVSQTKIRFSIGMMVLTSKLIDGTFPDYNRVIPQDNDKELVLPKSDFSDAVSRVSTIAAEHNRAVKLSADKAQLVLSCADPDLGKAEEELGVDYESEKLEIGFNATYLSDIAGQLDASSIVFMLKDGGSPALIYEKLDGKKKKDDDKKSSGKSKGKSSSAVSQSLYVLMPMRI